MPHTLIKFLREFLLILLIVGLIVVLYANPVELYQRGGIGLLWAYFWRGGLGTAILWQGNAYLSNLPDRWASWVETPIKRLFLAIVVTVVFTCLAWVLIVWLVQITDHGWDLVGLIRDLEVRDFIAPLIITFFISIFMHGRAFLIGWRQTLIEAEQLKKEQISARYEALKNQVNPHFLFNSLNVLAALVHKDADLAEQFIRRLAAVYRYILESRDREVVSLEEELDILKAYLFLMETRFGQRLQVNIRVPENTVGHIAPLSLQMLVENALKHNEISKSNPLHIDIFLEDGYVTVRNTILKKSALPESTGIGLANIQARYRVLSERDVLISDAGGFFTVKIPILSV